MGRRRDLLLVGASAVLVCGAAWCLWWVYFVPGSGPERGALALAIVTALVGVLKWLHRVRRPAAPRPVDMLADSLAEAVYGQWRRAAAERVLLTLAPIPVRWSLSELDVAGTVEAAVGSTNVVPLPGQTRVTEEQLRAGGGRGELFAVYAGITSGRLVVVGAPGAGKSGAAVLLVLDALTHRESVDDTGRARVPVPVLFTAHGWDPHTRSVQDWLSARLAADYPLLQHRGGRAEAAALVAGGSVALILDGLDEMDPAARPAALQALSDAPFRVVVFTRDQEMVQAARAALLVGAAAVQLRDVAGPDGADYLQRARTGPAPAGWDLLLTHLREHPDSVLTRAVSTPLVLTLIRDTYRAGDDVGELLNATLFSTTELIERHLIKRVLPAAYAARPGRPPPRYSLNKAQQTLAFIARQMNNDHTRDLAWWRIPPWVSTTPRVLTTGLLVTLVSGLVFVLVGAVNPYLAGSDSLSALFFGLLVGLVAWLFFGGPAGRVVVRLGGGEPQRVRTMNWRAFLARPALLFGLFFSFSGGSGHLMRGLSVGLGAWFVVGLVSGLAGRGPNQGSPLGPRESGRHDRVFGLVGGLVFVLVPGLLIGLANGLSRGPLHGLSFGLAWGLVVGLAFWLEVSLAWRTTLAWLQLQLFRRVPAVALMPFLEDAHARGVLRTVGAVYQFRHATLQDQLAGRTTPSPAPSPVA
jgi:hypothetical protein